MKIACVTTCRGRVNHLRQTLPENLRGLNHNSVIVLLDYNDQTGLAEYIQDNHQDDIDSGKLVYYRNHDATRFHMAHAKNQAHRCAMLEGADILVTLDADNYMGDGFIYYIENEFRTKRHLSFLCPDFNALPPKGHRFNPANPLRLGRGFAGRMIIRSQDFLKAGGYNQVFDTWRGEDIDLIARLNRFGFRKGAIQPIFLNAIPHSSHVRFREYPDAEKFENDDIYAIVENAHDTVVNNGDFGCGSVTRNFDEAEIKINPLPTRVFGIGMQRTGTSSLNEAFKMYGFDSGHWESAEWAQTIWWEMNKWNRSLTVEKLYALCDNPIPTLYKKLDAAYPGSKFILTVRDEEKWIRSVRKFWTYEGNPQRWVWDTDKFSHKIHSIIYGTPKFDEQVFRETYRKHNHEVQQYFKDRPDDLFILDVNEKTTTDGLSGFLGLPNINNNRFPHRNKGASR
jgi:hypothetical protein